MRNFGAVSPKFWTDHNGRVWKVPNAGQKFRFHIPCHRALRAFVYLRDNFTCRQCGAFVVNPPVEYDGRDGLWTNRMSRSKTVRRSRVTDVPVMLVLDHVLSRRNGGSNHPSNLQALCDPCNCGKAGLVDAKLRVA